MYPELKFISSPKFAASGILLYENWEGGFSVLVLNHPRKYPDMTGTQLHHYAKLSQYILPALTAINAAINRVLSGHYVLV